MRQLCWSNKYIWPIFYKAENVATIPHMRENPEPDTQIIFTFLSNLLPILSSYYQNGIWKK